METLVQFPCKECIVKVVCTEACELLDINSKRSRMNTLIKKNKCPDCGDILSRKQSINHAATIGYSKCNECDHRFKFMNTGKEFQFLERMFK